MLVDGLAEGEGEAVGLAVEKGVDELTAFAFVALVEAEADVAEGAFEFVDDGFEGVTLAVAAEGDVFAAVGGEDEDGALLEGAPEVEEEVDGAAVCPLQVVEEEEEGALLGDGVEDGRYLFKESGLVEGGGVGAGRFLADVLFELGEPVVVWICLGVGDGAV